MRPDLFPVAGPWPGRLAVMPRPLGGDWLEDEVRAWRDAGVDVVASLLTPDEVAEFDLRDEAEMTQASQMRFLSLPVEDRSVPASASDFARLIAELGESLDGGASVAVHCRQGIGRAGLVAIGLLVRARLTPDQAMQQVSAARGRPVPETAEQQRWIEQFAPAASEAK